MEVDDLQLCQSPSSATLSPYTYIISLRRYGLCGRGKLWCHAGIGFERDCGAHNNNSPSYLKSLESLIDLIAESANGCLSCIVVNGQVVISPLSPPILIGVQLRLDSTDSRNRYKVLDEHLYL